MNLLKTLAFLGFTTLLIMAGCEDKPYTAIIQEAKEVKLFSIAATPTLKEEQSKEKQYVADYEVLKAWALTDTAQQLVKAQAMLLDSIAVSPRRRCAFIAEYAIQFDKKLTFVMSSSPCNKLLAINKDTAQYFDLTDRSQLAKVVEEVKGEK
jgi:hypothetical protein